MLLIEKFVNKTEFSSYDDFFNNFKLNVPANFNFTYDVMDVLAAETPDALAMLWIDDRGGRRRYSRNCCPDFHNFGCYRRLDSKRCREARLEGRQRGAYA